MRRQRRTTALLLPVALLVVAGGYTQHTKQGSVATITSDELEIDYGTGLTEMTGNVTMTIRGDYTATMTASRVTLKGDLEKSRILSVEAYGPVNLVIDTTNKDGQRTHITASCSRQATFSEQTMIVTMVGNAHAEIRGAEAIAAQVESAKYDGDSMTIDLDNRKISLKKATAEVRLAPRAEKADAAQGNP